MKNHFAFQHNLEAHILSSANFPSMISVKKLKYCLGGKVCGLDYDISVSWFMVSMCNIISLLWWTCSLISELMIAYYNALDTRSHCCNPGNSRWALFFRKSCNQHKVMCIGHKTSLLDFFNQQRDWNDISKSTWRNGIQRLCITKQDILYTWCTNQSQIWRRLGQMECLN